MSSLSSRKPSFPCARCQQAVAEAAAALRELSTMAVITELPEEAVLEELQRYWGRQARAE